MIDPPIVANQNLTLGVIFYEWWLNLPTLLLTTISLKILNLGFRLDIERWLIPPIIFTNQNLTENFKFEI